MTGRMLSVDSILDPKVFDFNTVMAKVKLPKPKKVSTFLRPDLGDRILELQDLIAKMDEDDTVEMGVGDEDPRPGWEAELDGLIPEFNDSEVTFEFRPQRREDKTKAFAAMRRDQLNPDKDPDELFLCYLMSILCTNVQWTGAEFTEFRDAVGEASYVPLVVAAMSANQGPAVSAPFSPRPSNGPTSV